MSNIGTIAGDPVDNTPDRHPENFLFIPADDNYLNRWKFGTVELGAKGQIRLSQIAAYKADGSLAPCEMHVSLYANPVASYLNMPHDDTQPYPYWPFNPQCFQPVDKVTGLPPLDPAVITDDSLIMGWGNGDQKGGYSPGVMSLGHNPTGMIIDENTWNWDFTNRPDWQAYSYDKSIGKVGGNAWSTIVMAYVAVYVDCDVDVYVQARFFKAMPQL
jgi:hypothetical protein